NAGGESKARAPVAGRSPRRGRAPPHKHANAGSSLLRGSRGCQLLVDSLELRLPGAERLDGLRVELPPRLNRDLARSLLPAERRPVRPRARHRVERVRDREDAPADRDLFAAELVRIAEAVPALVVRTDYVQAFPVQEADRREH